MMISTQDNETVPVRLPIGAEDRGHGQGEDGHELDENVQGRARGVLERITDSVADDARFVRFRLLATVNLFVFDVLLGVVPRSTSKTKRFTVARSLKRTKRASSATLSVILSRTPLARP